eukprot:g3461.t2
MSMTSDGPTSRAGFFLDVVGGVGVGFLGLGLASEQATAYEKEYLKEPTAEFKAIEARQSEFASAQRAYKQDFVKKLDAFLAVETDEDAVSTLNAMSNTVIQRGGLPESVRINDLLKTCRRKKAAMKDSGKWGTPVQIAYETLVQTTNRTNRLLNLAFEDGNATPLNVDNPEEPKSVPADVFKQGVREHAIMLGMLLPEDERFLWIAEESLLAPLPEDWVQLKDDETGHPYYYNQATGDSCWEHPRDGFYKEIYRQKKAASDIRLADVSSLMPPKPPPLRSIAGALPEPPITYTCEEGKKTVRYGRGIEEPPGDGDSACGEDPPLESTGKRDTNSDEVHRLRRQLRKSKESRRVMVEQHDGAIIRLERAKEDLEERMEAAADELRQEKKRFSTATLERDRFEKMSTKLKDMTRQLEGKLAEEERISGERASILEDLRNETEGYRRQLIEAGVQAVSGLAKQERNFQRRLVEAKEQSDRTVGEMKQRVEDDVRVLSAETEQIRAKMDFQVDERVREALEDYKTREQTLTREIDELRLALEECKQELAKTTKNASAAAAVNSAKLAEAARASEISEKDVLRRKELETEIERLQSELQQADTKLDAISVDLAKKNKLVDKVSELQRTTGEAQEGLRAANDRFNGEILRMNIDVANAEDALDKSVKECKRLEAAVEDAISDKEKAQALVGAERAEVKRLSTAAVRTETALTEAKSKVDGLTRQLQCAQQRIEASEGLERDLKRLGQDAEEMHEKHSRLLADKQREVESFRSLVEREESVSRKLRGSLAEAEGRALQEKGAAERLMTRVSSLESQVLEGRAALASTEADKTRIMSELTVMREAASRMRELKTALAEAAAREEALRGDMTANKSTLETVEASLERERHILVETRTDLVKRAEGAEKRCESLQSSAKELTQKLRDTERGFRKELEKSKERETDMWAQLQQVSSSFAEAASSRKDGEATFDVKLSDLEKHLKTAETQLLRSQTECTRVKEASQREAMEKEAELKAMSERLSRKKEKFTAQKLSMEHEIKMLSDKLSEGRVVEEGIRARCKEVSGREEEARNMLAQLQNARIAADQEAAGARAEATGLRNQLQDLRIRLETETARLREEADVSRKQLVADSSKNEAERRAAEESKQEVEARCAALQETTSRLEDDLARLSAQVATGSMDRDSTDGGDSKEITSLKFKVVECQGEIQQLTSRISILTEEKRGLEEREKREKALYLQLEQASSQSRRSFDRVKEESEGNKRLASAAREEAQEWKMKFEDERTLRRALNAKILDMQGSIRVLCRLRPLQEAEALAIDRDREYDDPMANITYPDVDRLTFWGVPYQFDYVFGPGTKQTQVFDEVQPMVASSLDGYRVCVFAYGQTGSGKTYTMEGPKADRGVNFRALGELFALSAKDETKEFQFRVSMLEVYNESIKDLFVEPGRPAAAANKHDIRLDKKGRVYVEGLVEREVETLEEVEELVVLGGRNRTVGNNNVNEHSSRSHLVLQVHITSTDVASGYVQHGKLNLIDLAGSERIKSTAAEGQQLKEAQNINRSLSALGDVINSLGSGSKHVPYRNSKLTFLLQDSLSSNAKVLMFVNINPAPQSQGESSCSLNFAKRNRSSAIFSARFVFTES